MTDEQQPENDQSEEPDQQDKPLTREEIKKMTTKEINANWKRVSEALRGDQS